MGDDNFTTNQVERELIKAFRTMDEHTGHVILSFAQDQATRHPRKEHKPKIRLVASAGRRAE